MKTENEYRRWVTKTRLLGMTVDHKLTWAPHALDIKKSFATKLDLLKRSRFLPTKVLRDFYFKVILPSVKYGLVLWGACCDSDLFHSIERLHCRASRIIFNLPKDMASCDAFGYDQWPTLFLTRECAHAHERVIAIVGFSLGRSVGQSVGSVVNFRACAVNEF